MEYGILSRTTLPSVVSHLLLVVVCFICLSTADYKWDPGTWSDCQAVVCGVGGHQIRDVQCFYEERTGELTLSKDEHCQHMLRPSNYQTCFKECRQNIYEVRWAEESWGPCQLRPKIKTCSRGMGVQYRNVTCWSTGNEQLLEDSVCQYYSTKSHTEQSCDLQCKQDCIVTPFGPWSTCDNCEKIARTRMRSVVIPNDYGGKECPPFSEIEPCVACTNVYYLSIDQWSPCVSMKLVIPNTFHQHPLIGHQKRSVKCIDSIGATTEYKYCKTHVKLQDIISDHQSCIIPQDCEVSEWTSWHILNSSCLLESGYTKPGLMQRERSIKMLPRGLGKSCPPLVETTSVQGSGLQNCPRNKWLTSGWSKCMPVNGGIQCATGMQHRKAICVEENESGEQKPVEDALCSSPRPTISQLCAADCDWDCTVSLWSQWSECKVTECDQYARKRRNNQKTGQRYRTREVLTPPGTNGRSCDHLSETQNCDPEPCYFWNMSSGPCSLTTYRSTGNNCGVGVAERTTKCVNRQGMGVRDELCSEWQPKPESQVLCEIPCPNDCVTSEWGEWSECPDICEVDQEKNPNRPNMRSRRKTILARAGPGGTECPGERELVENKQCPTVIECAVFSWHADPWGSCNLDGGGRRCGSGTQTRDVHCYNKKNNQNVPDEKCTQSVKPERTQQCMIPCPRDCTLTSWSEWATCSASCYQGKDNIPTRSRKRYILQEPDNNGAPCPEVLQEEQPCLDVPLCHQFQWKVSNWSVCILAPSIHNCGRGLRARDVTCIAQNGTDHPVEDCLKFIGPLPPIAEPCYKSCDKQCLFTDWSEWSHCIQGCSGHQFRSRVLTGGTNVPENCNNNHQYPTYEKRPCQLCETLKPTSMGEWSDCILDPVRHEDITNQPELAGRRKRNTTSLEMGYICGTGKRIKVVACSKQGNGLESADKCNGADYEEEICFIACPVDCEMSDWTSWSECPAMCGAGVQTRSRSIRRLPSAGGRQCPSFGSSSKEVQNQLCHPECVRYVWKTKAWGTCIPYGNQICGNGTQTRHVRCEAVNKHGYTTRTATDDMCSGQQRPFKQQSCYLYCLDDVVVSEWSKWTSCEQPCNPNARQTRTRSILRESTGDRHYGSSKYPSTRQQRACIKGDNCIEYAWELSSWTTCLINNGENDCGVGHKERYPVCKNHFGQMVEDELCEEAHGPVTEPLVVSCEEVCDVDCLVSDWSPWSACSKTCGLGISQRERTIVEQFSRNGRPCPSSLTQKRPCFLRGCYTWTVSEWSNCTAQVGICGHGTQTRNVSCVSEDGIALDPSKCPPDLNILIMHTEMPCKVPCPGECVITEWTEWNECYLSQEDFYMGKYHDRGIQSRSRAILAYPKLTNQPCPDKLWEKRHCKANKGMFFEWKTSPWVHRERTVHCERSDGLVVIGGCDEDERPSEFLQCIPPCPLLSTCNDTNTCICRPGFVPDSVNGILKGCLVANETLVKQEQAPPPEKAETSVWMYAVLAAGTVFIIFVALAFYNMSEHFRSGPRSRTKEDEEAAEKLNTGAIESRQENGVERLEHCPNVCTHNSAPTPATTNHLYENSNTNALWVRASTKSVRSRVARKFYSMLYFCGCSKHVHDTDFLDTYSACLESPVNDELFKRIPDVEYSDLHTISNQSSVELDLTESQKRSKSNGSDSAISMQNSSNDSGQTVESYSTAVNGKIYSKPDKKLKKYGSSNDKQRSFDSYTIKECDGNENEEGFSVVQLEHVSAKLGKLSPKSTLSHELYDANLMKFGGSKEYSEADNESQTFSGIENGSGLFSVHQDESDFTESLVDEMANFSDILFSRNIGSDNYISSDKNLSGSPEQLINSPSNKPKLRRQSKIVEVEIEEVPNDELILIDELDEEVPNGKIKHIDDIDDIGEMDDSKYNHDHLDINKHVQESNNENNIVQESREGNGSKHRSKSDDIIMENQLSEEGRTESWETFKDLVERKCYNARRKNKMSTTTTV